MPPVQPTCAPMVGQRKEWLQPSSSWQIMLNKCKILLLMLPDTRFELRRRWLVELVRVSGATDPKQGQTILPQLAEPATNPEIEQASDNSLCTRAVVMIVILVTITVVLVLILVKFIVMPR